MTAPASTRPNIICILIDDLGARDLGCTGSSFYETPHIDRLFMEGRTCTRAYASCPVCSPTRASLLTGKTPARVGITEFIGGCNKGRLDAVPYLHYLPHSERSLATALGKHGYQTWHVGKWHLGDEEFFPDRHGFDINIGGCHWGHPYEGYFAPWGISTMPEGEEGDELTTACTDHALRLLQERDRARPFFLNLWHYSVHTPIQAPEHLIEHFRAKAARLGLDRVEAIVEQGDTYPIERLAGKPIRRRTVQSDPIYAAMLAHLDQEIGRVLDALSADGLDEDTLVLFASDNGGLSTFGRCPTSNLPLAEGKGWLEEGGIRVPQAVRWTGTIPAGSTSDRPTYSCDWYPTVLAAAGIDPDPEQHADGLDLSWEWFGRGARQERDALFWHYPHYSNCGCTPGAAVLSDDGRWKLIHDFESDRDQLFDLAHDPSEVRDCAAGHPAIRDRLRSSLQTWWADVQARFPAPNPDAPKALRRPAIANNAWD